jgi:hypothetical protein
MKNNLLQNNNCISGFTIVEALVAVGIGSLLISGAAVSLKNIRSTMNHSGNIASLRSHAATGTRLLRSEVQKSQHLMVKGGTHKKGLTHTNLDSPIYSQAHSRCRSQQSQGEVFNPLFGLKSQNISDSRDVTVIYGYGIARNGQNYSLLRCGEALGKNGSYTKDSLAITPILENIGLVSCSDEQSCKETRDARKHLNLAQIANDVNTHLNSNNETPLRSWKQPALGIRTDEERRMLELIDPTHGGDHIDESYLQTAGKRTGRVDLTLLAYARNHPISRSGNENEIIGTFYGIPIPRGGGGGFQFIVDVSGSMGWGGRLPKLKAELHKMLNELPNGVTLSLTKFNSYESCFKGCKLFALNDQTRAASKRWVDSLYAGGGTTPWGALNRAMSNPDGRAIFFMTDGWPSWRGCYTSCQVDRYSKLNSRRSEQIKFNSIAVGANQSWMSQLSQRNGGTYKQI